MKVEADFASLLKYQKHKQSNSGSRMSWFNLTFLPTNLRAQSAIYWLPKDEARETAKNYYDRYPKMGDKTYITGTKAKMVRFTS